MKHTSKRDWQPPARNWRAYIVSACAASLSVIGVLGSVWAYDMYASSHSHAVIKDYSFHQDDVNLVKNALDPVLAAPTIVATGVDTTAKNIAPNGVSYTIVSQAVVGKMAGYGFLYPVGKLNFRHTKIVKDSRGHTYLKSDETGIKTIVPYILGMPVNRWVSGGVVLNNLFREPKSIIAGIENNTAHSVWKDDTQTVFTSGSLIVTLPHGTDPAVTVTNTITGSTVKITAGSQTLSFVGGVVYSAYKEYKQQLPLPVLVGYGDRVKVRKK